MKYCKYCGRQLEDNEVCSCHAEPPALPAAAPAKESLSIFKAVFSRNPLSGVRRAAAVTDNSWLELLAAEAVAGSLGSALLVRSIVGRLLRLISDITGLPMTASVDLGSVFTRSLLPSLLTQGVLYALLVGILFLIPQLHKKAVSFEKSVRAAAAALLPYSASLLVGGLVSFAALPVGFLFPLGGFLASFLLLYLSLQVMARFDRSPLWLYVGLTVAALVACALISGSMAAGLLRQAMSSVPGLF